MPLRFVLDEDTRDNDLWQAVGHYQQNNPNIVLDVVRVGDPGCPALGTLDHQLVEWAVHANRIIVSADANTLINTHTQYIEAGWETPGLLIIRHNAGIYEIVEVLAAIGHCCEPYEFASSTQFIPL